jgi:hypothetical protein
LVFSKKGHFLFTAVYLPLVIHNFSAREKKISEKYCEAI